MEIRKEIDSKINNTFDFLKLGYAYIIPEVKNILNETKKISNHKYNTHHLTCSCKEYRLAAKIFPRRDLRRLCKHLYLSLLIEHPEKLDPLTRLLVETNFWLGKQILFKSKLNGAVFYFGVIIPTDHVSIFLKNITWQRYVYDFVNLDWRNDLYPPQGDLIINKIKKIINSKIEFIDASEIK
ncbi:MAG: hypothetical protein HXY50_04785 [Ignavibacteriaceae bacterium]|nr:hypothetical protein [Ignavibacteriaceae bacterium]